MVSRDGLDNVTSCILYFSFVSAGMCSITNWSAEYVSESWPGLKYPFWW